MCPAKAGFNPGPAQRTLAIGIILDDRRPEHLREGDAHPLGDRGNILENRHYSTSIPKVVQVRRRVATATIYAWSVNDKERPSLPNAGLCDSCSFMRLIVSDRGSKFYMCALST